MQVITEELVYSTITKRADNSHKGSFGKVLVVGGNKDMGGAAILTSSAAVYSGAGLVTVGTAPENHAAVHARLPEAMVFDFTDLEKLRHQTALMDVIVIGPGLGLTEEALAILKTVFEQVSKKQHLIVDGSAITLTAKHNLPFPKAHTIYTPHLGEWEKMTGLAPTEQETNVNVKEQQRIGGIVVLKSNRTTVYFSNGIWKNTVGNPAMATGGMGDTLAGMIAGFVAQFADKEKAVLSAVYLHSKIGDQLAETHYVALPSQIIEHIPKLMKTYSK